MARFSSSYLILAIISSIILTASSSKPNKRGPQTFKCAICVTLVQELERELEKSVNSTEVIELARRPAADKGKSQGGRAIRYVDSEMRITDALQAACHSFRNYRSSVIGDYVRLLLIRHNGIRPADHDLEGIDVDSGSKLQSMCEDFTEEWERLFVKTVKAGLPLIENVCYGSKSSVCGAKRSECPAGTSSLIPDENEISGKEPCWPCERGKYQSQKGSTKCDKCPSGLSTVGRGSTSPADCVANCKPGSYGREGVEPCSLCSRGTYQPSSGSETCLSCPGGNGTISIGSASREDCLAICGDARHADVEGCEDGNLKNGDGCSASCQVEPGYVCESTNPKRRSVQTCSKVMDKACGDGRRAQNEECDDGNTNDGDGCSSECQVETGFRCIASEENALSGRSADVCLESARRTSRIGIHGGNRTDSRKSVAQRSYVPPPWFGKIPTLEEILQHDTSPQDVLVYDRVTFGKQDVLHLSAHVAALWRDFAGAHSYEKLLERMLERYGMPLDQKATEQQLESLGCYTAKQCAEMIVEKVYVRKALNEVCKNLSGPAAVPNERGGCRCMQNYTMDERQVCQPVSSLISPGKQSEKYSERFRSIFMLQHAVCRMRYGEMGRWRQRSPHDFQGMCDCEDGHFLNGSMCVRNLADVMEERRGKQENEGKGEGVLEHVSSKEHELQARKILDGMIDSNGECLKVFGKRYEADGKGGCKCQAGYTSDVTGGKKCVGGSDKLCSKAFGENVEFDGNNHCRCMRGFVLIDNSCVMGSSSACASLGLGVHSRFDGQNCVCNHGYMMNAEGVCEPGKNELCESMHGLAEYDGNQACICKRGSLAVRGEEGTMCVVGNNSICVSEYGDQAEYNRFTGTCECKSGFSLINDKCSATNDAVCQLLHGKNTKFDGNNNCKCARGYILDAAEKCSPGTDSLCGSLMGPNSRFDHQSQSCKCKRGFTDIGGTCLEASDNVCRENYGDDVSFDGGVACSCGVGRMYLKGKCVRSNDLVCQTIMSGEVEFDGQDACRCRRGFLAQGSAGNMECIKGDDEICMRRLGEGGMFDGERNCVCGLGLVEEEGRCVPGSDETCRRILGEQAVFDGVRTCRCRRGFTQDINGTCTEGSDEGCRTRRGPSSLFDRINNCTCAEGYKEDSSGYCVDKSSKSGESNLVSPLSGGFHDLMEVKKYFDLLDSDKNALLDDQEVLKRSISIDFQRFGVAAGEGEEGRRALLKHDLDHDNYIDFSEFWNFFSGRSMVGGTMADTEHAMGGEASGLSERAGEEDGASDKERFEKACKSQFGEAAMWDGEESCVCKEGYVATKEGCLPSLDTQCQQQFGEGAFFDGEMCDCSEGYKLSRDKTRCVPRRQKKEKKEKKQEISDEDREAARRRVSADMKAARDEADKIKASEMSSTAKMFDRAEGYVTVVKAEMERERRRMEEAVASPGDLNASASSNTSHDPARNDTSSSTNESRLAKMEERRKKREAEKRWKKFFEEDAMSAIQIMSKAKEAETAVEKLRRNLTGPEDASASSQDEVAPPPPESSQPEKPPPLSQEAFEEQLAKLKNKVGQTANSTANTTSTSSSTTTTTASSSSSSTTTTTTTTTTSPTTAVNEQLSPTGESSQAEAQLNESATPGQQFCWKLMGPHSVFDEGTSGCICAAGYRENEQGECSKVEG